LTSLEDRSEEVERLRLEDPRPIQLVVRRKPRTVVFFRAKPRTAYDPTTPQLLARYAFGAVARRARGRRFTGLLPPAAEEVARELRGRSFGGRPREPVWLGVLRAWVEGPTAVGSKPETLKPPTA
jgi:hypothetical protein